MLNWTTGWHYTTRGQKGPMLIRMGLLADLGRLPPCPCALRYRRRQRSLGPEVSSLERGKVTLA